MAVNRGKQFENVIRESLEKNAENISIDRLHDQTNGFKGSANICDFIVYRYPYQYYIECKSIHGNTWSLRNATKTQLNEMANKVQIKGVFAGIIVWFMDKDVTLFLPIQYVKSVKDAGQKSIRFDIDMESYNAIHDVPIIDLVGRKKRVFFDYDMELFFTEFERKVGGLVNE